MAKYLTVAVLAAAYKGKGADLKATLTHTMDAETGEPLCGKVNPEHLADPDADDRHARPTCPRCLKRDPRVKSEGGFLLGSLLQF